MENPRVNGEYLFDTIKKRSPFSLNKIIIPSVPN
jgi:hypothetical protein